MAIVTIGDQFSYVWNQVTFDFAPGDVTEQDLLTITPETLYHFTSIQITGNDLSLITTFRIYMDYGSVMYAKHTDGSFDTYDGTITIDCSARLKTAVFTLNDITTRPIKITGQSSGLGEPASSTITIRYCYGR